MFQDRFDSQCFGTCITKLDFISPKHHSTLHCLLVLCLVASVVSDSLWPRELLCPWNSPGKNIGMGCHALHQGIFPTQGSNSCLLWFLHSGRFFTIEPLTTYILSESHILFIIFIKFEEIDTIHFFQIRKLIYSQIKIYTVYKVTDRARILTRVSMNLKPKSFTINNGKYLIILIFNWFKY